MKKIIFLSITIAIVFLSIIVLNLGPGIHGLLTDFKYNVSCKLYADSYKYYEKKSLDDLKKIGVKDGDERKEYLDLLKKGKRKCYRDKAMIGLEYAAFNINVVFGAFCSVLAFLLYLGNANLKGKAVGLLGLVTGVVGFALTFAYIIESGIIITRDVKGKGFESLSSRYDKALPKIDSEGAYFKWDPGRERFVCKYYDKDNKDSLYLKFSDYNNKYLSYLTKVKFADEEDNKYKTSGGCVYPISSSPPLLSFSWDSCKKWEEDDAHKMNRDQFPNCDKLYPDLANHYSNNQKINSYNNIITAYIFSVFIAALHIGLVVFGFLLFRDSGNFSRIPVTLNSKLSSKVNIRN